MKTILASLVLFVSILGCNAQTAKEVMPHKILDGWIVYCNMFGSELEMRGLDGRHYPIEFSFPVRRCENYKPGHRYRWVVEDQAGNSNRLWMISVDEVPDNHVEPVNSWDN